MNTRRLSCLQVFGRGDEEPLVHIDVLCGTGNGAGFAPLASLRLTEGEVALDNLLLKDVEHTPQAVVAVFVTDGLEDVGEVLIGHLQLVDFDALADGDGLGSELPLLGDG